VTDVVAVAFANEGGIKLRIISKHDGNIELMAGKDTGIKSVQDLKGRSIAMSTNTIMEYTADTMLQAAGLESDDAKKVPIPQLPTRLEMLMGGKVDAAIMPEPLAGMAIKNGALILNSTNQTGNKCGAIAFRAEVLKDNPEEIKAVFRAYDDAVDYLNQEPIANYVDYVIKEQGFPEAVKGSLELPKYQKATAPDPKIVAGVIEWMQSKQLIKSKYEYKDLVDDKFLR
ncbi:MAG: ABC transporter substrate-binding protein, partial [Ignavibacteriales bacterium]